MPDVMFITCTAGQLELKLESALSEVDNMREALGAMRTRLAARDQALQQQLQVSGTDQRARQVAPGFSRHIRHM
jgi:hypothetical protein